MCCSTTIWYYNLQILKAVRYSTRVSRYTSQAYIVYRLGKPNIVSRIDKVAKMVKKLFSHSLSPLLFLPFLSLSLPPCTRPVISTTTSIIPCIVYRLVYRDTFAVSTRVSTQQEIWDIAQPYKYYSKTIYVSMLYAKKGNQDNGHFM